jgi:hypothetical protein
MLNVMNMRLKRIFENAEHPIVEEPSQKVKEWLSNIGLDQNLIEEFSNCSHSGPIKVNKIYFNHFNEFFEENLEDQNKKCIENGYLIIGSGLNGDPIVLHLDTCKVGYVSHDDLWEDEESDFKDMLAMTGLDVFEFYEKAYNDEFPVDINELEDKGLSI